MLTPSSQLLTVRRYCPTRNYIISCGYKVMSSTLYAQTNLINDPDINHKLYLRKWWLTRTKHLIIVRNPYDRIVSFYTDKFKIVPVRVKEQNKTTWQDCLKLLFPHLGISLKEDRDVICEKVLKVSFPELLNVLPKVYRKDRHLQPQIDGLFFRYKNKVMRTSVNEILKMENPDQLNKWGIDTSIRRNKSVRMPYTHYFDQRGYEIINSIYKDDFKTFGYEMY